MMKRFLVLALGATLFVGCGPARPTITDSDRRDAHLVLEHFQFATRAVDFEQKNPDKSDHSDPTGKTVQVFIHDADETRTKHKGSGIEQPVSKFCLALTTYWEMPDGKSDKAKAAAAEVEHAKADLQALADGK